MVRRLTAIAAGVGVMLVGSLAHAQSRSTFGDPGEFIFSADRLFPVLGYSNESTTQAGQLPTGISKISTSESSSSLGFFWGGSPGYVVPLGGNNATLPNLFTVPRLGFDYTIIPNLTVGGDVVLFFTLGGTQSTETDNNAGGKQTVSTNEPKSTIFGLAPRVGYVLHLTDLFHVWLRGGLSVYLAGVKQTVENNNVQVTTSFDAHQWAIDLDPQFVITPVPHFGFTAGLTADIPFGGGYSVNVNQPNSTTSVSAGQSLVFVGMTAGLVGWF
ncbi:MAG TPA: hypothetical protein VGL81_16995 [Polyangiaceae bacterium]|jgi:hypothetical protein